MGIAKTATGRTPCLQSQVNKYFFYCNLSSIE